MIRTDRSVTQQQFLELLPQATKSPSAVVDISTQMNVCATNKNPPRAEAG
jgi:hypothetical protein